MIRANERKHTWNLYWDTSGGKLTIYPRNQWEDGEIEVAFAVKLIDGDVPPEGWKQLAEEISSV
jgi:hypothetical protein